MNYDRTARADKYVVHNVTADVIPNNDNVLHDAVGLSGNIILTLKTGATFQGVVRTFKNSSSFVLRVYADTGVLFDGLSGVAARFTIYPGEFITVKTTSTPNAWVRVSEEHKLVILTTTDANYALDAANSMVFLPVITADRILTLPSPVNKVGRTIVVNNVNNSGFKWTTDLTLLGSSFSTNQIPSGSTVILISEGANWRIANIYIQNSIEGNVYAATGDGTATIINIPHGLGYTPKVFGCIANNLVSADMKYITADGTNFNIHFIAAPANLSTLNYNISYKR